MSEKLIPLTPEGYASLHEELDRLKSVDRPKVIKDIAEARAHGDLKENAEYHAAKEHQSFVEGRILELEGQLSRAEIIDFRGQAIDQVRIGAFVSLVDVETEEEKKLRIVGDLEADIQKDRVSLSSPLAKALLGKKTGEVVEFRAPKGTVEYEILDIKY